MLTDEQMKKAQAALRDHKSRELQKRIMLRMYRKDQETAARLKLPFRMLHKHEFPPQEIPPNLYYPRLSNVGISADGTPEQIPDAQPITPERAEYFFTRLIAMNETRLQEYAPTDWTGSPTMPQEAEKQRQAYFDRIEDFRRNPEKYDTEPHLLPEHPERIYFMFTGDDSDI